MAGPGTELKKILEYWNIRPDEDCRCSDRAKLMDRKGPDWCEENRQTIVGWLREEAERRGLPFSKILARTLIWRAIRKSRAA